MIPCGLDITFTTLSNTKIITYEIELPSSGKNIGCNLLDDEYFIIPFVTDKIPNSSASLQRPTQAFKNMWIVDINGK